MCVIIVREPGAVVPEDKLSSACKINDDGFGMSVVDRGKIITTKRLMGNPKEITKMLEDAKDQKVFLHLRFRTHGEVTMENVHPFESFEGDNTTINFMHNGIIHDFTDYTKDHSDTYNFNEMVLKPYIAQFVKAGGDPKELFKDSLFNIIAQKYASTNSRFTLYDNHGNELIVNRKAGKEFEGWWASNDSYFHSPSNSSNTSYYGSRSSPYDDGYSDRWGSWPNERHTYKDNGTQRTSNVGKSDNVKALPSPAEAKAEGKVIDIKTTVKDSVSSKSITISAPPKRETFIDLAGIESLKVATCLSESDIENLIENYPYEVKLLIMDLLAELYDKTEKEKTDGSKVA